MCLTDSYTDYGLSKIVVSSLNNKKNLKKYSGDKTTYDLLKKAHNYTVKIDSDNQGSRNLFYYAGTINKVSYAMSFKDLPDGRVKLEEVRLTKDMPD